MAQPDQVPNMTPFHTAGSGEVEPGAKRPGTTQGNSSRICANRRLRNGTFSHI